MDPQYTEEWRKRTVAIAVAAALAHQEGEDAWSPYEISGVTDPQTFDLLTGGMCCRFVRQVFETACGFGVRKWRYGAGNAKGTLAKLHARDHRIWTPDDGDLDWGMLHPGDIIGKRWGRHGHIMLFVGDHNGRPTVAENTSCWNRGHPRRRGTKLTLLQNCDDGVTGVYRLFMPVEDDEHTTKIVLLPTIDVLAAFSGRYKIAKDGAGDHLEATDRLYLERQ